MLKVVLDARLRKAFQVCDYGIIAQSACTIYRSGQDGLPAGLMTITMFAVAPLLACTEHEISANIQQSANAT